MNILDIAEEWIKTKNGEMSAVELASVVAKKLKAFNLKDAKELEDDLKHYENLSTPEKIDVYKREYKPVEYIIIEVQK